MKYINFTMMLLILALILSVLPRSTSANAQPDYITKVFDKNKVIDINIEIQQADWNWLLENAAKKEPRGCNITINGITFYNVAINPKGNSTLLTIVSDKNSDRFSFKLDFGKYVKGQTCFGLRKMALNNMYSDKTYMKEFLSYDLFHLMGVPTPAYSYANIKINGQAWGLYLAVEGMEESFVERIFGSTEGNLYKPENIDMAGAGAGFQGQARLFPNANNQQNEPNDIKKLQNQPLNGGPQQPHGGRAFPGNMLSGKGTDLKYTGDSSANYSGIRDNAVLKTTNKQDFNKVIAMIKALNEGKNLENYLDVDNVLRYFAVNIFLVNLDSYSGGMFHNYYLYEKDGVFKILPWDLNMSFAGMGVSSGIDAVNFPIDNPVKGSLEDAPLIGKLLEVPEYKQRYHHYLREITENYIKSGVFQNSVYNLDTLINSYVKTDATAFYTYDEYTRSLPILIVFAKERSDSITAQLKGEQPSTTYGNLTATVDLTALGGMQFGMGNKNQPNGEGMFDLSKVNQVMAIMQESAGKQLTDDQKRRLMELGLDESMINIIMSMGMPVSATSAKNYIPFGLAIAVLLAGLLLILKFKRKKFRS